MKRIVRIAALTTALATMSMISACVGMLEEPVPAHSYAPSRPGATAGWQPQIYMYRGGFNGIFSTGINEIAEELDAEGIPAHAVSWSARGSTLAEIEKAHANGRAGPIILVGHSLGASVVIGMANDLTTAGIPVDLVITLDPLHATTVPKGVKRFVNFKASGKKDNPGSFTPGPGFNGVIVNLDIRNLPSLEKSSHWNIVNQADLQKRVVQEIETAYRKGRKTRKARVANKAG